ncbi:small G protein signaling modulator 3 [Geosmithia morbida]|uniref:Small G protein signaling modulator 3 n=1 Tax=Geosmithia morbida TaxID=1094350 RepID=A0A9P4YM58_9HYPO|nr:small G protein signaling modulator 3 [Geosmithia morbida]KAF4119526.1 small G protein signaling modulator 3 [Geosmithia morbida]
MGDHSAAQRLGPHMETSTEPRRSVSQHSTTSIRSRRSATVRGPRGRKMISQPSSSACSSVAPSDKSLTSFPSFSPESEAPQRHRSAEDQDRLKTATQEHHNELQRQLQAQLDRAGPTGGGGGAASNNGRAGGRRTSGFRSASIVDSLAGESRGSLFEDEPVTKVPGSLHHADDEHIERLIARHGAVGLVRQIAEDLAQRDTQMAGLRRRADEREKALRRIVRECGVSNMELEGRLRAVEDEEREAVRTRRTRGRGDSALSDMMTDAMEDGSMTSRVYGGGESALGNGAVGSKTVRASHEAPKTGTLRGWKDYILGTGTSKKTTGRASSSNGPPDPRATTTAATLRSHSSLERRPGLQRDLFSPPDAATVSSSAAPRTTSESRPSSIHSAAVDSDPRPSGSLASLALRLVAGGAAGGRESEARGRTSSASGREPSSRAASTASQNTSGSMQASSVASGGPKALMAMRRTTPAPQAQPLATATTGSNKSQAQEMWETMVGNSPPSSSAAAAARQESYGPVEMDAILPPESQPPTLAQNMYSNYNRDDEFLTDRFGFIYDQRRKRRQKEATQMARSVRNQNRTEMISNGRSSAVSPNLSEDDVPSPKCSVSSGGRSDSPAGGQQRQQVSDDADAEGEAAATTDEARPKKWQDYLKIATFPTELLSHTPGMDAASITEVTEASATPTEGSDKTGKDQNRLARTPSLIIRPSDSGMVLPAASTTTSAVDSRLATESVAGESSTSADAAAAAAAAAATTLAVKNEDREPVKLLLRQLSDVHDAMQRKKTPAWNDFLRKVRAERRKEGEAAVAAANAAAEARYERPTMILPETRVADGEMIGVAGLGNKGKVGRAKWNEFKSLVLGGIPVAYRAKIWSECSGANALRVPGQYDDLVSQSGSADDPTAVGQIAMDIRRTLTDNIFFRRGPGVQKLNEVLVAYSRRNPDVGYCQGMNLIAANLLLMMASAEDAFWVLASIVESILPAGYYDHSLKSSRADQQVLRAYVSTVLPRLSAHLDALSIELETMTFQWFLSVFTDCLSAEALFRVWDVVLCTNDGSTFLFQVALALLKLNEGNLLQCRTPAAVYTYIGHHMTEHAISIDGLIQASDGLRKLVRRDEVEQRRQRVIDAETEALADQSQH